MTVRLQPIAVMAAPNDPRVKEPDIGPVETSVTLDVLTMTDGTKMIAFRAATRIGVHIYCFPLDYAIDLAGNMRRLARTAKLNLTLPPGASIPDDEEDDEPPAPAGEADPSAESGPTLILPPE